MYYFSPYVSPSKVCSEEIESGKLVECHSDAEYSADEEEVEDETTISEQELHEGKVDHRDELETLLLEGLYTSIYLPTCTCILCMYMLIIHFIRMLRLRYTLLLVWVIMESIGQNLTQSPSPYNLSVCLLSKQRQKLQCILSDSHK